MDSHTIPAEASDDLFARLRAIREANLRMQRDDPAAWRAKVEAELPTLKCTLCGEMFKGYGNSAAPVRDVGEACDACNRTTVLPARLREARRRGREEAEIERDVKAVRSLGD